MMPASPASAPKWRGSSASTWAMSSTEPLRSSASQRTVARRFHASAQSGSRTTSLSRTSSETGKSRASIAVAARAMSTSAVSDVVRFQIRWIDVAIRRASTGSVVFASLSNRPVSAACGLKGSRAFGASACGLVCAALPSVEDGGFGGSGMPG